MDFLLNSRYRIVESIGIEGGFGTTFLAEDTCMPSHLKCALKQLKPVTNNPAVYELVQQRFKQEAIILENLGRSHDQIPTLHAYFEQDGHFYLVQEWIEGQTLAQKVNEEGPLSEPMVKDIFLSILSVLDYIHRKGKIHRDIKPDNIILRQSDLKPVLIDFGAVKEVVGTVVNSHGRTTSSIVIGTPGFMPLEQTAGRPQFASDIYSLGMTTIYLLTGRMPHELESDPRTGEIEWRQFTSGVSPELAAVLDRSTQSSAHARYATVQELYEALQGPQSMETTLQPKSNDQRLQSYPVPPTEINSIHSSTSGPKKTMRQKLLVGGALAATVLTSVVALARNPQVFAAAQSTDVEVSSGERSMADRAAQEPSVSSAPTTQNSDEEFIQSVGNQLDHIAAQLQEFEYQRTHDPHLGMIVDNGLETHSLELEAGHSYALVAVCDQDCGDIDLQLSDSNGNVIDLDNDNDDNPVVQVTPSWTDEFVLAVHVPNCAASSCYYGLGVFGD